MAYSQSTSRPLYMVSCLFVIALLWLKLSIKMKLLAIVAFLSPFWTTKLDSLPCTFYSMVCDAKKVFDSWFVLAFASVVQRVGKYLGKDETFLELCLGEYTQGV